MLRVTCPSCQCAHDFLELYRGLTIVCKHCRAGVEVPKDAESLPEATLAAPEFQRAPEPVLTSDAFEKHELQSAALATPPPPIATETSADLPFAPRQKHVFEDDAPRPSNRRALVLAATFVLILLAGGGLVARSYWQQRNTIVAVNPTKLEDKTKTDPKPDEKTPKVEPRDIVENKKPMPVQKPAASAEDVTVLDWYTTKQVLFEKPSAIRLPDPKTVDKDAVFLIVRGRLSAKALAAEDTDEGWKFSLSANQFHVVDEENRKLAADGIDVHKVAALPKDKNLFSLSAQIDVASGSELSHQDVTALFIVPEPVLADDAISFQFGAFPSATLLATKRKATPAAPIAKVKEPKTPAPKASEAVEVVDWYCADEIPNSDKGMMQLSTLDKSRKYEFVVVKLKFDAKAVAVTNDEDKGFTVNLLAKDFAVLLDDEKVSNDRLGLEANGGFGDSKDPGYRVNDFALFQDPKPQTHYVHEVFVTAPKGAADAGKVQLQYRDYAPVKLEKERRRDAPAPLAKKPPEPQKQPDPVEAAKVSDEVKLLQWYTAETLPGDDPKTKLMPLSSSDRAAGSIFVVVKVKLLAKACRVTKGEVGWNVHCQAKDFTLVDADEQKHTCRGLEQNGTFGDTVGARYLGNLDVSVPFDDEPASLVQTVFFTVPRKAVIPMDIELRYRDYPALALTKVNQKK